VHLRLNTPVLTLYSGCACQLFSLIFSFNFCNILLETKIEVSGSGGRETTSTSPEQRVFELSVSYCIQKKIFVKLTCVTTRRAINFNVTTFCGMSPEIISQA